MAINLAMIFGAMVTGGVFVKFAPQSDLGTTIFLALVFGGFSGMMSLGLLTFLLNKEERELIHGHGKKELKNHPISLDREHSNQLPKNQGNGNDFIFSDGTSISALQLGQIAFRQGCHSAEKILSEFEPGQICSSFPAASAIIESPLMARHYLTIFYISIYLSYVSTVLGAPHYIANIMASLIAEFRTMAASTGYNLSENDQKEILANLADFAHAIDQDFASANFAEAEVINFNNAKATELLFKLLSDKYNVIDEFSPLSKLSIGHLLDDAPPSIMLGLQNELGLRLASY